MIKPVPSFKCKHDYGILILDYNRRLVHLTGPINNVANTNSSNKVIDQKSYRLKVKRLIGTGEYVTRLTEQDYPSAVSASVNLFCMILYFNATQNCLTLFLFPIPSKLFSHETCDYYYDV